MEEIWKDVVGYEGLYQVSNLGNVRGLQRVKWNGQGFQNVPAINCKKFITKKGYIRVTLSKNSIRKQKPIHRLVAQSFINNEHNKPTVNHIDGNKLNNHLSNLEWSTYKEQSQHAMVIGLIRYPIYNFEKEICEDYENGLTQNQISKKYNITNRKSIKNILVKNNILMHVFDRKKQVLNLLKDGVSIEKISNTMGVKYNTIMVYRSEFRKKGVI